MILIINLLYNCQGLIAAWNNRMFHKINLDGIVSIIFVLKLIQKLLMLTFAFSCQTEMRAQFLQTECMVQKTKLMTCLLVEPMTVTF